MKIREDESKIICLIYQKLKVSKSEVVQVWINDLEREDIEIRDFDKFLVKMQDGRIGKALRADGGKLLQHPSLGSRGEKTKYPSTKGYYHPELAPYYKIFVVDKEKFFKKFETVIFKSNTLVEYQLSFSPNEGITRYRDVTTNFRKGTKTYALLTFLSSPKNNKWRDEDIKKFCNDNISIERYKFKKEKDIRDTVNEIRRKLKVKKGEFFPIQRKDKRWIWLEK